MTDDRSLVRRDGATPAHRPAGPLVPRGTSNVPVHRPGSIRWTDNVATREECWQRLSMGVRERTADRLGTLIEWWAQESDGGISAVALGTHALIVVSPTVNSAGLPASKLLTVNLDEQSFRTVRFRDTSPRGVATTGRVAAGPATTPGQHPGERPGDRPSSASSLSTRLAPGMTGFLGLLPARAQQLLQDPFLDSGDELRFDCYAYLTGITRSLSGATIHTWYYLTDHRTLTFCAGVGHDYHDGVGAANWELTCWRVNAAPRQATNTR